MNKVIIKLFCLLLLVGLTGCAIKKQTVAYYSNADMIAITVKDVVGEVAEKRKEVKQTKMSVVDLNAMPPNYSNNSVNVLVQDTVIDTLVNKGFTVLDRDINLMDRISLENGEKIRTTIESKFGDAAKPVVKREDSFSSNIPKTADVVLGYRLLECGIEYSKGSSPELIRRNSKVKMNFRLINKDSMISWSEMQENARTDEIEITAIQDVEKSGLRFYGYSMPGIREDTSSNQPNSLIGLKEKQTVVPATEGSNLKPKITVSVDGGYFYMSAPHFSIASGLIAEAAVKYGPIFIESLKISVNCGYMYSQVTNYFLPFSLNGEYNFMKFGDISLMAVAGPEFFIYKGYDYYWVYDYKTFRYIPMLGTVSSSVFGADFGVMADYKISDILTANLRMIYHANAYFGGIGITGGISASF